MKLRLSLSWDFLCFWIDSLNEAIAKEKIVTLHNL